MVECQLEVFPASLFPNLGPLREQQAFFFCSFFEIGFLCVIVLAVLELTL